MNDQEWDYGALAIEVSATKAEIERLKPLLVRAADALAFEMMGRHSQIEIRDHSELIAELRKAAG